MKKKRCLIFGGFAFVFGFVFFAFNSVAQSISDKGGEGHGGDVVACFKNGMDKIIAERAKKYQQLNIKQDPIGIDGLAALIGQPELLDLYEIRNKKNIDNIRTAELIDNPSSFRQGVDDALERAKNTNYLFYKYYLDAGTKNIPLENFSLLSTGVIEVDDSSETIRLNDGCLLLQIAVQKKMGAHYYVEIDNRLFSRMQTLDQAALISHERIINITMDKTSIKFESAPDNESGNDEDSARGRFLNSALYLRTFNPNFAKQINEKLSSIMKLRIGVDCRKENECGYYVYSESKHIYPLNFYKREGIFQDFLGYPGYSDLIEYPNDVLYLGTWFKTISGMGNLDKLPTKGTPNYEKSIPKIFHWIKNLTAQFSHSEAMGSSIRSYIASTEYQLFIGYNGQLNHLQIGGRRVNIEIAPDFHTFCVWGGPGAEDRGKISYTRDNEPTEICNGRLKVTINSDGEYATECTPWKEVEGSSCF
ncbi:MAG: hypothetical protein QE271_14865 [Bacteriovoracaceae bacterium]|nr:hypothetical protein [Bacteriovoracaceae bacterium]